jgi:hypothetical protein
MICIIYFTFRFAGFPNYCLSFNILITAWTSFPIPPSFNNYILKIFTTITENHYKRPMGHNAHMSILGDAVLLQISPFLYLS